MLEQAEKLRRRQLSLLGKYAARCDLAYGAPVPLRKARIDASGAACAGVGRVRGGVRFKRAAQASSSLGTIKIALKGATSASLERARRSGTDKGEPAPPVPPVFAKAAAEDPAGPEQEMKQAAWQERVDAFFRAQADAQEKAAALAHHNPVNRLGSTAGRQQSMIAKQASLQR